VVQSVVDLVKRNIYITFPIVTNVHTTRRYDVLNAHIKEFGFRVGVELGVSAGETFFNLLDTNPNLFLYGVDTWVLQKDNEIEDYDKDEKLTLEQRKKTVFPFLQFYPNRCKIYEERTDKAHEHFENDSLDFIFIDANHSYESVKKDIKLWTPKVKPTGMIFGHDLNWGSVARAVGESFHHFYINADCVWASTRHHYKLKN
jgi:hypothetical protein